MPDEPILSDQEHEKNPHNICIWNSKENCEDCTLSEEIHCEMHRSDTIMFMGGALLFFIPSFYGMIVGGMGWWLLAYFVYWVVFFEVWENSVLCSHCPYYAEDGGQGHTLHCYANYGLYKTWPYNPKPMSRSHQIQFLIGLLIFAGFPLPFLYIAEQYLMLSIAGLGIAAWMIILKSKICPRCLNFSCPLNSVPKYIVDKFLLRNPVMRNAWEECGYTLN
ncbi:MAG: hypothetical protein ACXADL_05565 [Candidatus Thorarchaeota archaeon]